MPSETLNIYLFLSGDMPAAKEKAPEPSDSETSSYEEVEEEEESVTAALAVAKPKSAATAPSPAHTVDVGTDTEPSSSDSPPPRKGREPAPEPGGESSDSRAGLSGCRRDVWMLTFTIATLVYRVSAGVGGCRRGGPKIYGFWGMLYDVFFGSRRLRSICLCNPW